MIEWFLILQLETADTAPHEITMQLKSEHECKITAQRINLTAAHGSEFNLPLLTDAGWKLVNATQAACVCSKKDVPLSFAMAP